MRRPSDRSLNISLENLNLALIKLEERQYQITGFSWSVLHSGSSGQVGSGQESARQNESTINIEFIGPVKRGIDSSYADNIDGTLSVKDLVSGVQIGKNMSSTSPNGIVLTAYDVTPVSREVMKESTGIVGNDVEPFTLESIDQGQKSEASLSSRVFQALKRFGRIFARRKN